MVSFSVGISVKDSTGKTNVVLDSDLGGQSTLKDLQLFLRSALIKTSLAILREEQAIGFDQKPRVRVDNKFDRDINLVRPFGKIEFFSRLNFAQTIIGMFEEILIRSPHRTGLYERSNYVFLNNQLIATDMSSLKTYMKDNESKLKDSDFIRFINVTPYAARLEYGGISKSTRGANKGSSRRKRKNSKAASGKLVSKPNGAYVLAHRVIRSKFKQVANFIKFGFIPNGYAGIKIDGGGVFRTSYMPTNRRYSGPYVYPSITLSLNQSGGSSAPRGLVQ